MDIVLRREVRGSYRVVHHSLDTAEGGRVDVGLGGVPVQPRQQVEETVETTGLQEPGHEAVRLSSESNLETIETPTSLRHLFIGVGKLQL